MNHRMREYVKRIYSRGESIVEKKECVQHNKKKILLLATGGTIASEAGDNGLQPSLQAGGLLPYLVGVA